MTNSSQTDQSTALQTLTYFLVAVSVTLVSFVGVQLITEMNVAHGESIANPSELNAEFFADNSSNDLAQANTQDLSNRDEFSQSRGLLAQAGSNNNCDYLTDDLRIDMNNDSQQVYKLQAFLQAYAYDYVDLTGTFDEATLRAVRAFQTRHANDILEPWGYEADESTGYVYITTRQKINELYCDQDLDLTADQQSEIASYREQLNRWRAQGAEFDTPQYLAQYRTQQQNTLAQQTQNNNNQTQINGGDEMAAADDDISEPADDMSDMNNESESQTEDMNEATGTATNTDTEQDSDGFFSQLFGQGEEVDQADEQGTTTDGNDDGTTTQQSTDEDVGTAGTSGVDQAATSVYSGVNSVVGFIFSPTFLLILLGVLILLLIATLLEDDDGDAYAEITADDFAKDFDDEEMDEYESDDESNSDDSEPDSKTQSADFDDTPAGDSSDQSDNNAASNQEDATSSEDDNDSKSS